MHETVTSLAAAGDPPGGWLTLLVALLVGGAIGAACVLLTYRRTRSPARVKETTERLLRERGLSGDSDQEDDGVLQSLERLASRLDSRVSSLDAEVRDLLALIDSVADPVLMTETDGRVVVCNRALEELLDRRKSQMLGKRMDDLFTQDDLLSIHAEGARGVARHAQVTFIKGETRRVFEVAAVPVRAMAGDQAHGARVVLSLRDVTELATAVKLKTDFVANASHELRTPLASIRAALETLQDMDESDRAMAQKLVRMIANNTERLEALIADLLDLARLESPELPVEIERFSVGELFASIDGMFEDVRAERDLGLSFQVDPSVERIRSDPKLLLIMLKNLVDNAMKFAYEGTTIRVIGEPLPAEDGQKEGVRFRVIDKGVGIPLAEQQRIFERFHQVDTARSGPPKKRGTGLGLAIVKHATRALGGSVDVQSVWKQGTTMIVDLPGTRIADPSPATTTS